LKGIQVSLISADYAFGALRYGIASSGITNGDGEYTIPRVSPGRSFFVLAANGLLQSRAISDVPANPENRKSVLIPAYYPGTDRIESATGVILGPGEKREFIDIQMKSSPSRCLEGIIRTLDTTGSVRFEIGEDEPPLWTFGVRTAVQPRVLTGEDGRIRICDLHPGDYWLKAYSAAAGSTDFGIETITIGEKDVSGISVTIPQQFPVEGDVVWDGQPPQDPVSGQLTVGITSTVGDRDKVSVNLAGAIPHHFTLPVSNHGYVISVQRVPAGAYIKDITYGGRSILNEVFQPGAAAAADGLRIVLARDGAYISVRVADMHGNAAADASVIVFPANASSEATMASAMITGQTNAFGTWSSALVGPGKYYVIATTTPTNHSVETIAKLWRTRVGAELVEVDPGATVQVSRVLAPIE
jgi:hypothetical protein